MRFRTSLLLVTLVAGTVGSAASAVADPATDLVCDSYQTKTLWPPNHKYRNVDLPTATDPDAEPGEVLVTSDLQVTQDEPVNGAGDGNTSPDAREVTDGLQLRGERAGPGDGRFYHISVTYTDVDGNEITCEGDVVVPHDKGKSKKKGAPVDSGQDYNSFG